MSNTNIPLVRRAFKEQEEQHKRLVHLVIDRNDIDVRDVGTVITYDFTKCNAGDLHVQDVFKMFQNWPVMNTEGRYKKYHAAEVQVCIADKPYQFKIEKTEYDQLNIYNSMHPRPIPMLYQHLFDAVKTKNIPKHEMARYMLQASKSGVGDCKTHDEWRQDFPFLELDIELPRYYKDGQPSGHERIQTTVWELLCDIMVITQVAEAARPVTRGNFSFEGWMSAAGTAIFEDDSNEDERRIQYYQHLARELNINRNSDFTGRVPYADVVFRKLLHRLQHDKQLALENLKSIFEREFPICRKIRHEDRVKISDTGFTDGGTSRGRYHILFDAWIREQHEAGNIQD